MSVAGSESRPYGYAYVNRRSPESPYPSRSVNPSTSAYSYSPNLARYHMRTAVSSERSWSVSSAVSSAPNPQALARSVSPLCFTVFLPYRLTLVTRLSTHLHG